MFQRIHSAMSRACLIAACGYLGLWAMGTSSLIILQAPLPFDNYLQMFVRPGYIRSSVIVDEHDRSWSIFSEQMESFSTLSLADRFRIRFDQQAWDFVAPQWLLVLIAGLLAILFHPKFAGRFSVQDLFKLTTIIALTFGIAVATL